MVKVAQLRLTLSILNLLQATRIISLNHLNLVILNHGLMSLEFSNKGA